jgi:hypothetical protein
MDLSRRGDDKIARCHTVRAAADAEVAVSRTVSAQVKLFMPMARVRMSDIGPTIKQQAVKPGARQTFMPLKMFP